VVGVRVASKSGGGVAVVVLVPHEFANSLPSAVPKFDSLMHCWLVRQGCVHRSVYFLEYFYYKSECHKCKNIYKAQVLCVY
jgi:hypothetical protein